MLAGENVEVREMVRMRRDRDDHRRCRQSAGDESLRIARLVAQQATRALRTDNREQRIHRQDEPDAQVDADDQAHRENRSG